MRRRVDGRVRSVGGLLLAGAMVLAVGVPASAQVTVEELCNVVAAEAGAEGPAASPAVEAAASPAVEGTTGMSQVTAELLLELCTRAGLGAVASPAAAEASAAAMESAAAIEASAAPMASPAASPAA